MKRNALAFTVIGLALALALMGCDRDENGDDNSTAQGEHGNKITLEEPADVTIRRGGMADVELIISREGFDGEISVSFDDLPGGVSPVNADKNIVGDEATYRLQADEDAELLSNHQAKVTVTGPNDLGVAKQFRITVEEME
jgi:hypothetical protein